MTAAVAAAAAGDLGAGGPGGRRGGFADPELRRSVQEVREALLGFRRDVEEVFEARRRYLHNRWRINGQRSSQGALGEGRPEVVEAICRNCNNTGIDFLGRACSCPAGQSLQADALATSSTVAATLSADASHASAPPFAAALPSERRSVGISGVGRLEAESPEAKGTRVKRELSVSELGGEEAVRELVTRFLAEERSLNLSRITSKDIQEVWVNELGAEEARVSALYLCQPSGSDPTAMAARPDIRQFCLSRVCAGGTDGGASWRVERMLRPDSDVGEDLEASVQLRSPKAAVCQPGPGGGAVAKPQRSPKRQAPPPPLDAVVASDEPASAPADGDGAGPEEGDTLLDAVKHGLEVCNAAATPRAFFEGFARSSPGSLPSIRREKFLELVAMYAGRSPAAGYGEERLATVLFEDLAIPLDGGWGVPYDVFCTELCPGKVPEAESRIKSRRDALLRDLRAAAADGAHGGAKGVRKYTGEKEELREEDFRCIVERLLEGRSGRDEVAEKALWCELVRGQKAPSRVIAAAKLETHLAPTSTTPKAQRVPVPLSHSGTLDLSDDESSAQEMSQSDALIDIITPFTTPRKLPTSGEGRPSGSVVEALKAWVGKNAEPAAPVVKQELAQPCAAEAKDRECKCGFAGDGGKQLDRHLERFAGHPNHGEVRAAGAGAGAGEETPEEDARSAVAPEAPSSPRRGGEERGEDEVVGDGGSRSMAGRITQVRMGGRLVGLGYDGPAVRLRAQDRLMRRAGRTRRSPLGAAPVGGAEGRLSSKSPEVAAPRAARSSADHVREPRDREVSPSSASHVSVASRCCEFDRTAALLEGFSGSIVSPKDRQGQHGPLSRSPREGSRLHGAFDNESNAKLYMDLLQLSPEDGAALAGLGCCLRPGQRVCLGGEELGRQEILMRAIASNPGHAKAHAALGHCLEPGAAPVRLGGRDLGAKELYLRALELDPTFSRAHRLLIDVLEPGETVQLASRDYGAEELRKRALEIESQGRSPGVAAKGLRNKDLCLQALEFDPTNACAYAQLAAEVCGSETVHVCGRDFNQRQLFLRALELDEECARAYTGLGSILGPDETFEACGRTYNKKQFHVRALELNPQLGRAYKALSHELCEGERVTINGQEYSTKELERRASDCVTSRTGTPRDAAFVPPTMAAPTSSDVEKATAPIAGADQLPQKTPEPRQLRGLSPLSYPKDLGKVFKEADADGDGILGLSDLRSYLGDYLKYGGAEITAFHRDYGEPGGDGVSLEGLKRGLRMLDPYNIAKQSNRLIVRKPGAFGGAQGVDLHIEELDHCTVLVCDRTEQVFGDELSNCQVLIGPCNSAVFVRKCYACTFWVACKQLRTRDCKNCVFYLHSQTEPAIETSERLSFAPFAAEYPELTAQFEETHFDNSKNFWNAPFDFSGRPDHSNWSIRSLDECETLVVSLEGCAPPDSPVPPITHERLIAAPPESGEAPGQSVANIPQTRPGLPSAPSRQDVQPRRRTICDGDGAQREGKLDDRGKESEERPPMTLPLLSDMLSRVKPAGLGGLLGDRGSSSSGEEAVIVEEDPSPVPTPKASGAPPRRHGAGSIARAQAASQEDDSDDGEVPVPVTRKAMASLLHPKKGPAGPTDSDDEVLASKPAVLTGMARMALGAFAASAGSMGEGSGGTSRLGASSFSRQKRVSPKSLSVAPAAERGRKQAASSSDTSSSDDATEAEKYKKWIKNAKKMESSRSDSD